MEQFVQSVHIAVTMQLNAFVDERMKNPVHPILHVGRDAQVWVVSRTGCLI